MKLRWLVALAGVLVAMSSTLSRAEPVDQCPTRTLRGSDWYRLVERFDRLTAVEVQYAGSTGYESIICVNGTGKEIDLADSFELDWRDGEDQPRRIAPGSIDAASRFLAYKSRYCEEDTREMCEELVTLVDGASGGYRTVSPNYEATYRRPIRRVVVLRNGAAAWSLRDRIVACDRRCRADYGEGGHVRRRILARGPGIRARSLKAGRRVVSWVQAGKRHYRRLR